MTKTKHKTTIVLMFIAISLSAQTTTKELTDKFFELYAKSPELAINFAFDGKCMTKMQERTKALKAQMKPFLDLYGWYISNEQISENAEGNSVKITTFIVKYDCQPIKIKFVLYKPKDVWTMANLYIDTM